MSATKHVRRSQGTAGWCGAAISGAVMQALPENSFRQDRTLKRFLGGAGVFIAKPAINRALSRVRAISRRKAIITCHSLRFAVARLKPKELRSAIRITVAHCLSPPIFISVDLRRRRGPDTPYIGGKAGDAGEVLPICCQTVSFMQPVNWRPGGQSARAGGRDRLVGVMRRRVLVGLAAWRSIWLRFDRSSRYFLAVPVGRSQPPSTQSAPPSRSSLSRCAGHRVSWVPAASFVIRKRRVWRLKVKMIIVYVKDSSFPTTVVKDIDGEATRRKPPVRRLTRRPLTSQYEQAGEYSESLPTKLRR